MIRRLIAKLFGYKAVWLIDHDGEMNHRIARPLKNGDDLVAVRVGYGIKTVFLKPDGKVEPECYVKTWIADE
jgi:hypothetical protein